jgi:hypothetical protein
VDSDSEWESAVFGFGERWGDGAEAVVSYVDGVELDMIKQNLLHVLLPCDFVTSCATYLPSAKIGPEFLH